MPQNKSRVLVVTTRSWTNVEPFVRSLESAGFTAALVHGQAGGHTLHDASVMMFLRDPCNSATPSSARCRTWPPIW